MSERKYIYIVPILASVFFLASLASVITLGVTFDDTVTRNYSTSSVEAGDFDASLITIPSSIDQARMDFFLSYSENVEVDIYIMETEPPSDLTDSSDLLASPYISTSKITSAEEVDNSATLYLDSTYTQVYVIIVNPSSNNIDNIYITINIDDESSSANANQVVKIISLVIASILTFVFLLLSIYFSIEAFGSEYIEPKILTDSFEQRVGKFVDKTESWELFLLATSLVLLPFGLADWLISSLDSPIPFLVGMIFVVVYFSYNNRNRTYDKIRTVLKQKHEIALSKLSNQIDKDQKATKKAVMNLIIYENFPAQINYDTDMITYHPEGLDPEDRTIETTVPKSYVTQESKFAVSQEDVVAGENKGPQEQPTRPLPECAYCGEVAITHSAQFCHSCGASMSSAK